MTTGDCGIQVKVNGGFVAVPLVGHTRFTEAIELIKSMIDPDHIITDLLVDGMDPTDSQWHGVVSQLGSTAIIEVETGPVESYVAQKMAGIPAVIDEIYLLFRQSRKSYRSGNSFEGNKHLAQAVKAAKAFFEWYASMLNLVPIEQRAFYDIGEQVKEIGDSCQKICTQQLYQNWSGMAEVIENDLEPKLDHLESFSRRFEEAAKAA